MAQRVGRTVGTVGLASLLIGLGAQAAPLPPEAGGLPSDAEIRRMLDGRIGDPGEGIGIVLGMVGPEGRRLLSHGRPFDGDTAFEIGSITKVFTALLLADMVGKGEVALADPVSRHLPDGVGIPGRNGRSITLLDLATHTSGLPFMPDDAPAANASGAEKDSVAELYRFLAGYELRRDIGAGQEYSNLGYWLLGEALAFRGGMDYESLLQKRVLGPLGLPGTAVTLPPALAARLTPGHDAGGQPAPPFSTVAPYGAMPAAGGLVSTANDLLALLEVALGYRGSPLAPAMAVQIGTRRPTSRPGVEQALGWTAAGGAETPWFVHDGGTWGYAGSVAWDPRKRIGVVVLSNQGGNVGDIARHLLRPDIPLAAKPAAVKRTEISLDPAILEAYAGHYEAPGEGVFVLVREGDFLTIQPPPSWGLPKLRLRPESRHAFFVSELPLRVTIQTGGDGQVKGLLIHPPRGQEPISALRIGAGGGKMEEKGRARSQPRPASYLGSRTFP